MEKRHANIVEEILKPYPYAFYAFGSRVKGTSRKFSDLDLCYIVDIPFRDLRRITQEFEDSTLPFKVDIINYSRCTKSFQEHLKNELILFNKNSNQ